MPQIKFIFIRLINCECNTPPVVIKKWWKSRGLGSCKCIYLHEIILKPQNQDMEWTRNYKDTNQLQNAAHSTIGTFRRSRKRKARSNVDSEGVAHWPVKHTKRGKCKQCTAEKQRHEVNVKLKQCKVFLCIDNGSFEKFHVKNTQNCK